MTLVIGLIICVTFRSTVGICAFGCLQREEVEIVLAECCQLLNVTVGVQFLLTILQSGSSIWHNLTLHS